MPEKMINQEAIKMIEDDMRLHHDALSGKYRMALRTAIEALKEQEPIEPCSLMGEDGIWQCGRCGAFIGEEECYCHECGRPVKWNDQA